MPVPPVEPSAASVSGGQPSGSHPVPVPSLPQKHHSFSCSPTHNLIAASLQMSQPEWKGSGCSFRRKQTIDTGVLSCLDKLDVVIQEIFKTVTDEQLRS